MLVFVSLTTAFCAPMSQATETNILPRTKPNVPPLSPYVDNHDYLALEAAYKAFDQRNWKAVRIHRDNIGDEVGQDLLTWKILTTKSTDATFDEILSFAEKRSTWPKMDGLLARAEEVIPKDMKPEQIIAWFAGQEPVTGEGKIRLGEAFLATGQDDYGRYWIEQAWIEHNFSYSREKEILAAHKTLLSRDVHEKRMTRLLWHRQHSAAKRLLNYVSPDMRALANARIVLASGPANPVSVLNKVPDSLKADPGLIYDQVYGLRRRGKDEATWPLLINGPTNVDAMVRPDKWWTERHLQARKALKEKDYNSAYQLAANNGLKSGGDFAEAEFLAGWLALRYLSQPDVALKHFENLERGVSFPISLARARYWQGRAAEALGDTARARAEFSDAGLMPYTFYGQLALDHPLINAQTLELPSQEPVLDHLKWAFDTQDDIKAIRLLDEFDRGSDVRSFIYHLADGYQTAEQFALLAQLAKEIGDVNHAIRVAKKASQQHIALIEYSYPTRAVPEYTGGGNAPDAALVFGLSRQESEFNPRAVSHAGAYGLMQLLPSTARLTAKKHRLQYNRSWLIDDPEYNTLIGMAHLSDLIDRFDGSYIMTVAAYNAGALRIDQWVKDYGDPRKGEIDAVDWIESIPFKETRNYVQRVMENTQVYRGRLAGTAQPNQITYDINRKFPKNAALSTDTTESQHAQLIK
ncbi:MAG: lytic transglycosylase domain-containing protein [Alphaproteobacteria bacterium]|nr:MAG: lytic transglycosylase domain-containing protein [Alphaproteobacteria bacterium]